MSLKNKPRNFTIYDPSRDEPKLFRADSITPSYSKRLKKRSSSQSLDTHLKEPELFGHWAKNEQPFFKCEEDSDKNIGHCYLDSVTAKNGKVKSVKELPFVLKAIMSKPKQIEQAPKKKTIASCVKQIKKILIELHEIINSFTKQIKQIFSLQTLSTENKAQDIKKNMKRLMQQLELSSESLQLESENKKLNSLCFEQKKNTYSSHKQIESPSNQNRSMQIASTNFSRFAYRLPQTERKVQRAEKLHYSLGEKTSESGTVNFNAFNATLLKMKRISFQGAIVKW